MNSGLTGSQELEEAARAVLPLLKHDYINYGSWDGPTTRVEHRPTDREPNQPCRRCALEAALGLPSSFIGRAS